MTYSSEKPYPKLNTLKKYLTSFYEYQKDGYSLDELKKELLESLKSKFNFFINLFMIPFSE